MPAGGPSGVQARDSLGTQLHDYLVPALGAGLSRPLPRAPFWICGTCRTLRASAARRWCGVLDGSGAGPSICDKIDSVVGSVRKRDALRMTRMAGTNSHDDEMQQLWSDYEAALWAGLAAVRRQDKITRAELDELSAEHRSVLRMLGRLRELIER